jgi:16S rRNA processing protein RimM
LTDSDAGTSSERVAIGAVRRPHGIQGAVKIVSFSGETEHFSRLREVELRSGGVCRRFAVDSVEIHDRTPVITFAGISSPEEARSLSGWEIWVPTDHAAALGPDEYYVTELIGMCLVAQDGEKGEIVAVADGAQAPLLEVEWQGRTALVPFMDPFIGVVDRADRTVELLTPWVLDTE